MKKLKIGIEVEPSHAFGRAFVEGVSKFAIEQKNWNLRTLRQDSTPYKAPDAASIRKWLRALPKPAAVFCCNDHRAYQVVDTAFKAGISIPHDVVILGCDNDTMLCSFAQVPISSIDSDPARVGYAAARLLNAIIKRKPLDKAHRTMRIPPKGIVERESTEFAPYDPPWLAEAVLTIERNLTDGISANEIFESSGFSPPHVEKVFKAKLGCSVQTYITRARMKKAVALLRTGDLSTKEIAAACGYASAPYFCRVFKTHFGTSPQDFA